MSSRRSIRLKNHDYTSGVYFITLVTDQRRRLFGEIIDGKMCLSPAGEEARDQWLNLANLRSNTLLDEFVVMPDHFHAIIWLKKSDSQFEFPRFYGQPVLPLRRFSRSRGQSLASVIGSYKSGLSRYLRSIDCSLGQIWQRDYFERIVMNKTELLAYRKYIRDNPKNWKESER